MLAVSMSSSHDIQSAFDQVTGGYYRDPDPARAAVAFRRALAMLADAPRDQLDRFASLLYLFGRIAAQSPAARAALAAVAASLTGRDAVLAAGIAAAPDDAAFPDAMTLPIASSGVLDFLWAEFFVTGQAAPVARIIGVLDGEDRVRRNLETWLAESEGSGFDSGARRAYADALCGLSLDIDLDARTIRSEGDLDCLAFAIAERGLPIFKTLVLPPADVTALAIKGSALWSLRLNAAAHPAVAALCRAEAERPGGPARRLLRDLVPASVRPFRL